MAEAFRLLKKITKLSAYVLAPIFFILLFIVNLESIKNSTALAYFYTKPWNIDRLSVWLAKNLPPNVQVKSHSGVNFPEGKNINRVDWPIFEENSLKEFQEDDNQFAVMNIDSYHLLLYDWFNLSPKQMIKYSGVPYEYLANTFPGLALEEWLDFTVGEFFKPWQTNDLNYLVFKIPSPLDNPGKKIVAFNFAENEEGWRVKGTLGQKIIGFIWDENEGYSGKGSLKIDQGASGFSTAHFSSPPIPIKPGKYYIFSGWIKNSDKLNSRNRDGFLRMEFFKDRADAQISKDRLKVALSARVFGTTEWVEKKAEAVAPEGAHFVVLSFQRNNLSSGFSSWLDEVALFESDTLPPQNFPNIPYIKPKISEKELYPISIL